ncbi:hypothetical protein LR48_Vigan11g025800 [Vigna angularis]|uniref:Uncharacterized protein n=1 Tax=Phaseolus angularis TaxID=3914 RepID=A0A0L9VQ79_PHAAN|nr:hypothetical protein LR48_Vigan11g025800 [Vigna angularis]
MNPTGADRGGVSIAPALSATIPETTASLDAVAVTTLAVENGWRHGDEGAARRGESTSLAREERQERRGWCGDSGDDRCRRRQFWPASGMRGGVGLMEGRAATIGSEEETLNFVPREKKRRNPSF